MHIGLHLGQPAPPPVINQRANQPHEQADPHGESRKYAQAS